MSRKSLLTLFISIAAHVAVVVALEKQDTEQRVINTGAVKAPVSLSFSTISQPKPEPIIEKIKPESKPEPVVEKIKPEPKPEAPKKAKPVLKKPEPKPEPEPTAESKKQLPKTEPVKEEKTEPQPAPEPVMEKTVLKESKLEGLSNEPVLVSEPAIRNWKQPRYPKIARRRNQQGIVMLDVVVDEQGNPETIDILTSSGFSALDKAAIAAVGDWAFEPEKRNNQLVKSRVYIPVAFKLN